MQLAGHDDRKRHLEELVEVRRVVEVPIARLAANARRRRRPHAASARSRAASRPRCRWPTIAAPPTRSTSPVAAACGNETLAELYAKVLDAQFNSSALDSLLDSSSNLWLVKQVIFDSAKTYNEIADAIFEGNADRAIAAVEKHLDQVETATDRPHGVRAES